MTLNPIKGTATIGTTEWSLTNGVNGSSSLTANSGPVKASFTADVNAVAAGDQFRAKVYAKSNGGTQRLVNTFDILGAQGLEWYLPELTIGEGWEITLTKVAGTDRSILWTIVYDDGVSSGTSAATIAAAVWDLARSGHSTAGTFGEGVASVIGAVGSVTGNVGGNVLGTVASVVGAVGSVTGNVAGSVASVTGAVGSVTSVANIAAAIIATAIEGTKTLGDVLRGSFRLLTAKKSGYAGGTVVVRDAADTKNSMTIVADATGVTSVTYTDLT